MGGVSPVERSGAFPLLRPAVDVVGINMSSAGPIMYWQYIKASTSVWANYLLGFGSVRLDDLRVLAKA